MAGREMARRKSSVRSLTEYDSAQSSLGVLAAHEIDV